MKPISGRPRHQAACSASGAERVRLDAPAPRLSSLVTVPRVGYPPDVDGGTNGRSEEIHPAVGRTGLECALRQTVRNVTAMDTEVIVGFGLTGFFLVVFLAWTWHELRRVGEIAGPPDSSGSGDESED